MRGAVLMLAVLAACGVRTGPDAPSAPRGDVRAAQVTLYRDTVTARMSDGALCAAVREGRAGPWAAPFRGCPHAWPVDVIRPTAQARVPLTAVAADPWVTLGGPSGVQGFGPRR